MMIPSYANIPSRRPLIAMASALVAGAFALTVVAEAAFADPPPWAPAHGYRAKQHGKKNKAMHDQARVVYRAPYGIDTGKCNRDLIGAALGGAAGAAAGSAIGGGDGKTAAIVGGAIVGALVGGTIGRSMDQLDQNCVSQILEHADDGKSVAWSNPDAGARYQVTPAGTYRDGNGNYCREYTTTLVIDGTSQQAYGTACRQPDGSWQFGS
jgi:surface antigen